MFLQANPGRGKSDQEKEDMRKIYKPGDNVLPKLRRRRHNEESEEELRMLEEVRQISLQEVGVSSGSDTVSPPSDARRRNRSRDREERRRRARDTSASRNAQSSAARSRDTSPRPRRVVEHQSSLRSLLSVSDFDSQEMEEEIMRQIREDGLLDGIDLENIDASQEEEITERIAAAFRRRQRERERARLRARHDRSRSESNHSATRQQDGGDRPSRRPRPRAESATQEAVQQAAQAQPQPQAPAQPQSNSHSRPPVSRPHLFEAVNGGSREGSRTRSSSQDSNRSARRHNPRGLSIDSTRPAARSATDLSNRPQTTQEGAAVERQRPSQTDRRVTDPERPVRASDVALSRQQATSSAENSPRRALFTTETFSSPPLNTPAAVTEAHASLRQFPGLLSRHAVTSHPMPAPVRRHNSSDSGNMSAKPSSSGNSGARPTYTEPSVSCSRCGKQHIEYSLHYNCRKCDAGNFNLCLRCYRQGSGCRHWFGFGHAAWARYERRAPPGGYPPGHEHPHILTGHRYTRPKKDPVSSGSGDAQLTEEDPSQRLQAGVFCDICLSFANGCYWKCDMCNEGAWGFCNDCVNQGRHCTHPLLPLQHRSSASTGNNSSAPPSPGLSSTGQPPITPKSASLIRGPGTHTIAGLLFRPLTFSTLCDICTYPIPPSHTRFHCQKCNAGNSDICTSCYHNLVTSCRISPENGHNGWRRCPRNHRMVVVGFEDRDAGQRRIVTRDLVGGLAMKDSGPGTIPIPPDSPVTQAPPPPDPAAAGTTSPVDAAAHAWRWRDTDGTIRKARMRTGLIRSNSAASTSSITRDNNNNSSNGNNAPSMNSTTTGNGNGNNSNASGAAAAAAAAATSSSASSQQVAMVAAGLVMRKKFPPDGGVGLRAVALWSYWPQEGVLDELMFPKGAEIREAEDINGDWFWGCYAGGKGLFPGNYVRVL
ncbi:hypothetical protein MPH_11856 [Macrophomina phaseolina MS6]|uniref:SH3 domain-containing protein n=1 Tax=Macrophomina phaseolina (strain MS6) TaxID=1126212 RepID=K2RL25_MACPH|nr:hypothetical protein MPH_11856 [Macrophomina phaseolina MS6]